MVVGRVVAFPLCYACNLVSPTSCENYDANHEGTDVRGLGSWHRPDQGPDLRGLVVASWAAKVCSYYSSKRKLSNHRKKGKLSLELFLS